MAATKKAPEKLNARLQRAEAALAERAAAYPTVTEDRPWGHRAFKVNKKAFLFMATQSGELSLSLKLPKSRGQALEHHFAEPTGYGLGRSGWISSSFKSGDDVPLPLLLEWLDESFRAIAPKRLLVELESTRAPAKPRKTSKKKTSRAAR